MLNILNEVVECKICGRSHNPNIPHNLYSEYYQDKFVKSHGRKPHWADAMAHCEQEVKDLWIFMLTIQGQWSQPDHKPIQE